MRLASVITTSVVAIALMPVSPSVRCSMDTSIPVRCCRKWLLGVTLNIAHARMYSNWLFVCRSSTSNSVSGCFSSSGDVSGVGVGMAVRGMSVSGAPFPAWHMGWPQPAHVSIVSVTVFSMFKHHPRQCLPRYLNDTFFANYKLEIKQILMSLCIIAFSNINCADFFAQLNVLLSHCLSQYFLWSIPMHIR